MLDPLRDDPAEVLKDLGGRLRAIDLHMVGLIAARLKLAQQVGYAKKRQATENKPLGADIYREDIEAKRLQEVHDEATRLGINPFFAVATLYSLIGESCKQQMIQREQGNFSYGEVDYEQLKLNAIALSEAAATTYDERYTEAHPATAAYLEFEAEIIEAEIAELTNTGLALDLGCYTGQTSLQLASYFDRVIATEMSEQMIERARVKAEKSGVNTIDWRCVDIEDEATWSAIESSSVDFVAMTLGSASDVRAIEYVLGQIERTLVPRGRFVLSFYNTEALHLQAGFSPWPSSLAAVIDSTRQCLDVWVDGKSYSIYARSNTVEEIDSLLRRKLSSTSIYTHPTMAALLPREVMIDDTARAAIVADDRKRALTGAGDGAYILVAGRKS